MVVAHVENALEKVSKGNNLFANRLYHELAKKPGNIFFSSLSAHIILSLVAQGACGENLKEFNKVLTIDKTTSADGYQGLTQSLENVPNITLNLANKVYVKEGYELREKFKTVATDNFRTEVESIDFLAKKSAADNINRWCSNKTNNKIKDIVTADEFDEDTRLVLLNAIYFKGEWHLKFNKTDTKKRQFYLSESESVPVDMMFMVSKFNYVENPTLEAQILEMEYKNKNFSMFVILPLKQDGIHDLEEKISNYDLSTLSQGMRNLEVHVQLPKFKFETVMPLNDVLMEVCYKLLEDLLYIISSHISL